MISKITFRHILGILAIGILCATTARADMLGPGQRAIAGDVARTNKPNQFVATQNFNGTINFNGKANATDYLLITGTGTQTLVAQSILIGGSNGLNANGEANIFVGGNSGLVFKGQGAIDDVQFLNKNGASVAFIQTGTSAFSFVGVSLGSQSAGTLSVSGAASTPTLAANGEGDIWLLSTTGGLALIGKGSANDVTVLNSAGTTTLTIPTGTTNLVVAGTVQPGALTASLPVYTDGSKNLSSTVPSGVPAVNAGGVTCGTGCTSVTGSGSRMTVTTGTAVTSVTVNFSTTWGATPVCTASDNITASTGDISAVSTTAITFGFSAAVTTGTIYAICAG